MLLDINGIPSKLTFHQVFVGSYDFPQNHTTSIVLDDSEKETAHIRHVLQETSYFVNLRWPYHAPLGLSRNEPLGSTSRTAHRYTLSLSKASRNSSISFTAHFSAKKYKPSLPLEIQKRNKDAWNTYWQDGGFVDLTSSSNSKADELQRRIIRSQYHVRVNSAATGQSPQESGLMNNGWYGKLAPPFFPSCMEYCITDEG